MLKKSIKILIVITSIIFIAIIILVSFFGYKYYQNISLGNNLEKYIEGNDKIAINNITDFEWDKVYIFGPYTQIDEVNKTLGHKWRSDNLINEYLLWDFVNDDDGQLLIFTKNNKVIRSLLLGRGQADFTKNELNLELNYTEASFIKDENNYLLLNDTTSN